MSFTATETVLGATHPTGCVAPVNKIIPFSLVDGPGSRTAVFLQGCNIRCAYCHNPETQVECISCQACVKPCPAHALSIANGKVVWDNSICINCDNCIKVCQHKSTPKIDSAHEKLLIAAFPTCHSSAESPRQAVNACSVPISSTSSSPTAMQQA